MKKMYYFTKQGCLTQIGPEFYGTIQEARKEAERISQDEQCNIFINEGEYIVDIIFLLGDTP